MVRKSGSFAPGSASSEHRDEHPLINYQQSQGNGDEPSAHLGGRRYSTQLQPIKEDPSPLPQIENKINGNGAQYFRHANGGHVMSVPRSVSGAYDNLVYDAEDEDGLPTSGPDSSATNIPPVNGKNQINRQVSFMPSFSQLSATVNDSSEAEELMRVRPHSILSKTVSATTGDEEPVQEPQKSKKENGGKERLPDWDRFVTLPPPDEDETQKSEWVEVAVRWLKVFAYFFTFVMVLGLTVFSKTLTLLLTSMAAVNQTVLLCNHEQPYDVDPPLDRDKEYIVLYTADTPTRIAWVWSLYFAAVAPYVFAFGRSVRIIYFKTFKVARIETICTVLVAETLHCFGLSLFLFWLLPQMDVIKGAMLMNSVCFVPSIIRLLVDSAAGVTENKTLAHRLSFQSIDSVDSANYELNSQSKFDHLKLAKNKKLAWANYAFQTLIVIMWTFVGYFDNIKYFYLIPAAMILVSFEWWENYVVPESMRSFASFLSRARQDLIKSRYFTFAFIAPWKILLIFLMMLLREYTQNGEEVAKMLFENFTDGFHAGTVPVIRDKRNYGSHVIFDTDHHRLFVDVPLLPMWTMFLHVCITYLAYAFAKFTCKVCFQSISFAIPLCLTVPTSVSLLWFISSVAFQDKCQMVSAFSPFQYVFWNTTIDMFDYAKSPEQTMINVSITIIWMIGFVAQVCNTLHIWKETSERLASTEQLFVNPMYNAVMIDQSLMLNRRSLKLVFTPEDEEKEKEESMPAKEEIKMENGDYGKLQPQDEALQDLPRNSYAPMYDWSKHMDRLMKSKGQEEPPDDWTKDWHRICEMMGVEEDSIDAKADPAEDDVIRIYICATMWHEDQNEMFQMLKAVMRLDYEQGLRRIAKKEFGDDVKKVIYEMEVDIFFDDAFEQGKTDDEDDRVVNRFVEQLIDTIGPAANEVFGKNLDLEPPTIVPTPYGGKLIWKMPMGTNRLIAHIKDKNLIRHRKRWSQCMYMYYLLGYRLAARKDLDMARKKTIMNNTFVLALDGDINFRPQAVDLVVDLMKKNNNLGAACGRIHPIGSGPIVWYQKFEYAMGHWLQKATEHVIGCVLCSPGCFSLFRARALMDKSVMNKYTTKPSAARHYVQYDQGEDRWLCTLLLQRGWRIEYCAASDSYTHAPEGFAEFYTQRRRWGPSTMANILDLLGDYKQTVKVNDNISNLYILYQGFLMLGTIISPGTIFLMVVSAMNVVMGLSTQMSLIYNMIPLLAFMFVCLKFKDNNIKINFATILSVIYALLMLAVLVGTGIDMYTQGFFSPNSLFFSAMMASFVVAAMMHPQEFACLLPLPIYMLFIPSMYMLLTIYSITNMNVVSWGTREVKSKLSAKEMAKEKAEAEAKAAAAAAASSKKKFNFMKNVGGSKNGLFTCMCCSGSTGHEDISGAIQNIQSEVKEIGKLITKEFENKSRQPQQLQATESLAINQKEENGGSGNSDDENKEQENGADDGGNTGGSIDRRMSSKSGVGLKKKPRWVRTNERMNTWPVRYIPAREEEFWKKMVAKYLYPLDEDLKEKERISNELADLRNKFVFAFAFLNIIFILFVFMLQLHKDVFGVDVPVGVNGTIEIYDEEEDRITREQQIIKTRMDPINLTLVVFFGAILIIQCIGMFIHRFGTLAHLLAYTEIWEKKKKFDYSSFVAQLIKDHAKRYNRRRKRGYLRQKINQANASENGIDMFQTDHSDLDGHDGPSGTSGPEDSFAGSSDEDPNGSKSSDAGLKPSQYGDVVGKVIQNLKSDQSQIEKMPDKIMRQNTKRVIKRQSQRRKQQQQQQFNRMRRDSNVSYRSMLTPQSSIGSHFQQTALNRDNSNASRSTVDSQSTVVDIETNATVNSLPMTTFNKPVTQQPQNDNDQFSKL